MMIVIVHPLKMLRWTEGEEGVNDGQQSYSLLTILVDLACMFGTGEVLVGTGISRFCVFCVNNGMCRQRSLGG